MDHTVSQLTQPHAFPALLAKLQELLALQEKFLPNLTLPVACQKANEVTFGMRDGSAHILRCLKVWYDLPSDVLFCAINFLDRFLTKMKVQPKHLACVSIASFHLACRILVTPDKIPEAAHMISISQCNFTLSDLCRMESIIRTKLEINVNDRTFAPVTSMDFVKLLHQIFSLADINSVYEKSVSEYDLFQRLEVIACDSSCINFRPSEIAFVLICSQMDVGIARVQHSPCAGTDVLTMIATITEMQQLCNIGETNFYDCLKSVLHVVRRYNSQSVLPYRQRLVWRLSQRTLRDLRPTNKLVNTLPTIDEISQQRIEEESY